MSSIFKERQNAGAGTNGEKPAWLREDVARTADEQQHERWSDESNVQRRPDGTFIVVLNRLINTSRQAAMTTRLADGLSCDPDFKYWLHQLSELHEAAALELQHLLEAEGVDPYVPFSLSGCLRRFWMRCARRMLASSDFVLMDVCRNAEYRVQAAYEVALWVLPPDAVRDAVEDRFQQFMLHRPMIPARRLPQTNDFLQQADRLQRIHSPRTNQETDHVSSR